MRKESGDLWDAENSYSSALTWHYPVVGFLETEIQKMLNFNVQCGSAYECFLAVRPNVEKIVPSSNNSEGSSKNSRAGASPDNVPSISSVNTIVTRDYIIQRLIPTKAFDFEPNVDFSALTWRLQFDSKFNNTPDVQVNLLGASCLSAQNGDDALSLIFSFKFLPKYPMIATASLLIVEREDQAFDIPLSIEARDDNIDVIIDLKTQQIKQKEIFKIPFAEITEDTTTQGDYSAWIEQSTTGEIYTIESKRSRSILLNFVPKIYGHVYRACLCIQQKAADTPSVWRCALRGWAGPNPIEAKVLKSDGESLEHSEITTATALQQYSSGMRAGDTTSVEQRLSKTTLKAKKRDFIAENMQLIRTANSSKIKGAKLTK